MTNENLYVACKLLISCCLSNLHRSQPAVNLKLVSSKYFIIERFFILNDIIFNQGMD